MQVVFGGGLPHPARRGASWEHGGVADAHQRGAAQRTDRDDAALQGPAQQQREDRNSYEDSRESTLRMPGANIPGVLTAGTFYQHGKRVFWDVYNPDNTVVIELKDERYNELIVEVTDPQAAVELVKAALPRQRG